MHRSKARFEAAAIVVSSSGGIKIGRLHARVDSLIGACTRAARADMMEKGDTHCPVFCPRDFARLLFRELHPYCFQETGVGREGGKGKPFAPLSMTI